MSIDPFADLPPAVPGPDEEVFLAAYLASLQDLCDYDPKGLAGFPLGMLHCPKCSCMVLAGVAHPKCDPDFCGLAQMEEETTA